jgi:hypothetical protein
LREFIFVYIGQLYKADGEIIFNKPLTRFKLLIYSPAYSSSLSIIKDNTNIVRTLSTPLREEPTKKIVEGSEYI